MRWIKKGTETTIKEVVLRNMGVSSTDDINAWFKKSIDNDYKIKGLKEAVEYALSFKDKKVTICGDYDADGVTSTSILYIALKRAGFTDVHFRIPKRFSEGFGINTTMIDEAGEGLIITCDNGVAQPDVINYAVDKGLAVIVTDHHEPLVVDDEVVLPNVEHIIDPNAIEGQADFNGYCGAGIAYKFSIELLGKKCSDLLAFAAIGTVADVMQLREENYVIVRNGLNAISERKVCPGLSCLLSVLSIKKCYAHDIGFGIGPVINASSRLNDDGAKDVVNLFISNDSYAFNEAERLVNLNTKRKELGRNGLKMAKAAIEEECLFGDVPLTVYVPGVPEGIIGIIAGNLCEEYKVPAIVVTDSDDDTLKGSARSPEGFNIKEALDNVSELLIKHGGHAGAAGLSLKKSDFYSFREAIKVDNYEPESENITDVYYDLEIDAKDISSALKELEKYEPFGEGNSAPVFKINAFSTSPRYGSVKKLQGENHIKLYGASATAIGFGLYDKIKGEPKSLDLIGKLSYNCFNGNVDEQVEFVDFNINTVEGVVTPLASRLRELATAK